MSHLVELRRTVAGVGVFLKQQALKNQALISLQGPVVSVPSRWTVQIGLQEHVDIEGSIPSYLNHSCEPTSYIDFQTRPIVVRAARDLPADAEVTFDYDLTEWDMASPFKCGCGSPQCRGLVRGLRYRPTEVKIGLYASLSPAMRCMVDRMTLAGSEVQATARSRSPSL